MTSFDRGALVTGAGGFIGSHLSEELVRRGIRVRAMLHYNSRGDLGLLGLIAPDLLQHMEVVFADLRDIDSVRRYSKGVDCIFHLGASIGIPYSYRSPRDVIETNVLGTLNVLQAGLDVATPRVINISSSEVYGTALEVPIRESHPLQGQSPYSASKIGAEKLAESFYRSFELPVTTIRPFNNFGPRQSTRAVIPTVIVQALNGSEIRLGSTSPKRDFTYVTDTTEGFIQVASSANTVGTTLNLGTGLEVSVEDVVEMTGALVDKKLTVVTETERMRPKNSEVGRLVADATEAHRLCGWEPKVSFAEGLKGTVDWVKANLERFNPRVYGV